MQHLKNRVKVFYESIKPSRVEVKSKSRFEYCENKTGPNVKRLPTK